MGRGGLAYVQTPCRLVTGLKVKQSFLCVISELSAMLSKRFRFLSESFNRLNLKRISVFFLLRFYQALFQGNNTVTKISCLPALESNLDLSPLIAQ